MKKRIIVVVDEKKHQLFKSYAALSGVTFTALISGWIDEYIEKKEETYGIKGESSIRGENSKA